VIDAVLAQNVAAEVEQAIGAFDTALERTRRFKAGT
jgi:hypothetical protein